MISFRVKTAGYNSRMDLFLDESVSEIYNYTRGYPRKITKFCHQILKELILQNKHAVDRMLVRDVIAKEEQYKLGAIDFFANVNQSNSVSSRMMGPA